MADPFTGISRPRDYVQSLEQHVALLQRRLSEVSPGLSLENALPSSTDFSFGSGESTTLQSTSAKAPQSQAEAPTEQSLRDSRSTILKPTISSELAVLCLSAAGREPQYFGKTSVLSFATLAEASLPLEAPSVSSPRDDVRHSRTQPQDGNTVQFPLQAQAWSYSQSYLQNVHGQYPFLHFPTFREWEEECLSANAKNKLGEVDHIPRFFVLMVYSMGASFMNKADDGISEAFYSMALEHITPILQHDSIESVQAILACAVYSVRSPAGASTWKLSGMALRQSIELGYHRDPRKIHPLAEPKDVEMSKRVFWVAYDLDRAAAMNLGRPFGISDDDCDVELPLETDDFSTLCPAQFGQSSIPSQVPSTYSISGAIHCVRLRQIQTKICATFYPSIPKPGISCRCQQQHATATLDSIRKELDHWYLTTPAQFSQRTVPPNTPFSVFASGQWFRMGYCHTMLLLYRHQLVPYRENSVDGQERSVAFEECVSRAREQCLLYRKLQREGPVRYTWGSLHHLFLAGLTFLHCIWTSEKIRANIRRSEVISTCTACTTVLLIIAERWSQAVPYRDIFESLADKTIAMICGETEKPFSQSTTGDEDFGAALNIDFSVFDEWITDLEEVSLPGAPAWLLPTTT